jgi:leader peptidase (prepilin peptidase)/N-methyltransferase
VVTGVLASLCFLRFGTSLTALAVFALVCSLIVITYIDLDYMIIPNVITYPGTLLGVALGAASSYVSAPGYLPLNPPLTFSLSESLLGIALGAGSLYLIWWLYLVIRKREGLGLGDVKLLAMLGALLGPQGALVTIFLGSVFGSVIGGILILLRRHSFANYLSFGPYLVVAALVYIFNISDLVHHLLDPARETVWKRFQ